MRIVINLLLVAIIALLAYLTIDSIKAPIQFRQEKDKREKAVANRLKDVRTVQEMHRQIYGYFADDFNSLKNNIDTGELRFISIQDDPNSTADNLMFIYDTTYTSAMDSVNSLGINLDSIALVPYTDGKKFSIATDTIMYQNTPTLVLEVGVRKKEFMGPWADASFSKYDDSYNPNGTMKFGSLDGPNLGGNWE